MADYIYELKDSLYINLTNRCNNRCSFCIKYKNRIFEGKHNLWLDREPDAEEVTGLINDPSKYRQIVFCGYGEPLIRLETLKKIAAGLKEKGSFIRVDTDGQANLFYGRNITADLNGLVDEMDISLNAHDKKTYDKLCRSVYGEKAYKAILDFARLAKETIPKVVLTAVDLPGIDIEKCKNISDEIGVEFKIRPYYEESYIA
ncbi:MAG: TatD family nuclease-associated radical SAM protein [Candidatus Saganbacteria bacterium]|nr:TatD family nuclease-associated radical SAM protein [Candidatus Saganbacteria bacterium]